MTSIDQVAWLLAQPAAAVARRERRFRLWRRVAFGLVALAVFGVIAVVAFQLVQAWEYGDWSSFWSTPLVFVAAPQILRLAALIRDPLAPLYAPMLRLHAAILAGDDQLAPLAVEQPSSLQAGDGMGLAAYGPMRRLGTGSVLMAFALAVVVGLLGIPTGLVLLFIPNGQLYTAGIITLAVAAGLLIALILVGAWLRRGLRVRSGPDGLKWRSLSGRRVRLDWQQARAFYHIHHREGGNYVLQAEYYLDAGDVALAWWVKGAGEIAAVAPLLALIAARTGLPLRDASVAAQAGVLEAKSAKARGRAHPAVGTDATGAAGATSARAMVPRRRIGAWVAFVIAALLLLATLYGGGALLQRYQPQYFAGLPARVHAETPVAQSDLRGDVAPGWHGVGMDPDSGTYIASTAGYTLTGTAGEPLWSIYSGNPVTDGAFEVTAAQSGELTKDGGDGVGIVLRSDANGTDFLTFIVGYDGIWGLWWFNPKTGSSSDDWTYLTGGSSAAISKGPGDENKLLVIARGKLFLFYVNDRFIGSYYARYDDLPSGGYAGVYLDDGSLTGKFTDFAVYPTPPLFAAGNVVYNG